MSQWFISLTPRAFCQKYIFWTFWRFSGWIWAKLAPMYSKSHLQHDSMPFFPLALRFTTFLLNENFEILFGQESDHVLIRLLFFISIFAFPFSPFLITFPQWLTFYWACFQFKKLWESIIETGYFYHEVATCSLRKFCSEFFTQISEHFCAYMSQSLWSGYHWKDPFLLQKLSTYDANFGQRWWHQK